MEMQEYQPTSPISPPVRVLLVEDDSGAGEPLALSLAMHGYQVTWAMSGAEALSAIRSPAVGPSIVLIDLNLPDQDGVQLARALRLEHIEAPLVLVSGQPQAEIEQASRQTGAIAAFQKPVTPSRIAAAISDALAA